MSQRVEPTRKSGQGSLFDLRLVLALLFIVYGVVLTLMGLISNSPDDMQKTGGWNVNLWAGIVMIVVAGLFGFWARTRPLQIQPEELAEGDTGSAQSS